MLSPVSLEREKFFTPSIFSSKQADCLLHVVPLEKTPQAVPHKKRKEKKWMSWVGFNSNEGEEINLITDDDIFE